MAGKTVEVALIASTTQYDAAMARAATIAEETGKRIGAAGLAGGNAWGAGIEKGTSKVGNVFEKLGSSLGNWGIPFAGNLTKIGNDFQNVETKGKAFGAAMSAVGGVTLAALVGIGAESIHVADKFEAAQSQLETAVKNSGNSWAAYKNQIDAAYNSAAKLGFENNDVASALQELTTATKSPQTALNDIGLAEDIARMKGISLADASQGLVKVYGGSTSILKQWGINLDIGSDKLKSIQSAEEAVQSSTLRLNTAQAEVKDGQLQGVAASSALEGAQLSLRNANLNLTESQKALPEIMQTLEQRTNGAAAAYGKTLPGEMKTAEAEIHNVGVAFGEFLVPKVDEALAVLSKVVGWLEQNKLVAEGLAGAIGTVLGGAITVFVGSKVVSFVKGIGSMITSIEGLILKHAAAKAAMLADDGATATADQTMLTKLQVDTAALEAQALERNVAIESTATTVDAVGARITTAYAGIEAENVVLGASFKSLLGPIGLVVVAVEGLRVLSSHINGGAGIGGTSIATDQAKYNQQIAAAQGNASAIAKINAQAGSFNKTVAASGMFGNEQIKLDTLAQAIAAATITGGRPASSSAYSPVAPSTGGRPANNNVISPDNGISVNPTGGAPITTITPADAALEDIAKSFQGLLQRAGQGGTGITQQPGTVAAITAALSKGSQESSLVASLNATKNPTLVGMAQSIETTWSSLSNKLAGIIDSDTKTGQSEIAKLQAAQSSTSFASLKNAVTGEAKTSFDELVRELTDVHSKKLDALIQNLKNNFSATVGAYQSVLGTLSAYAQGDALNSGPTGTAAVTGNTAAAANAGSAAVTGAGLQSQQAVDNLNAAAASINDAAKLQVDAATLQVQAIQAQTTAIQDQANAQVTAINDQTQTQVDTLGERGLYGLQLVAQQAKVVLDQQKALDDASIAAAQAHLDAVTAQTNQTTALAQQKSDQVQQQADQAEAQAQATADSSAITNATAVAAAQAQADSAATQAAIDAAAAQAHVDAVQFSGTQATTAAQAAQYLAQQQDASLTAAAQANLTAITNSANLSNTNAQDSYTQSQAYWTQQLAYVQQQLSAAQNDANTQQALAQQSLAAIQGSSAITEAKLTAIYNVDNELVSTQFAGGYVVNVFAQPGDGPLQYANAVSWAIRTSPS